MVPEILSIVQMTRLVNKSYNREVTLMGYLENFWYYGLRVKVSPTQITETYTEP